MRRAFMLVHRWAGLTIAAFLFLSGVTGAVISWDHELDDLLNSHLTTTSSRGPVLSSFELARRIEARDPRVDVTFLSFAPQEGEALEFFVSARVDPATGRLFTLDYNQVFVDPVTGAELGRRNKGAAWPIKRETFIPFLYKLHYTLHLPDLWGRWLMGGVAVLWTIDCFVGFYLTLPRRRPPNPDRPASVERVLARGWWSRWKPVWKIKTGGSAYRVAFDLHRALSLWTWLVLFTLAFTGFSLNLYREIFFPLMSTVSTVTPTPLDIRKPVGRDSPIVPRFVFEEIVSRAQAEALRRDWKEPVGAAIYANRLGLYGVAFFSGGDILGRTGNLPRLLFYDGTDGTLLGDRQPWVGTAADMVVQAQFPLHSGRILGLPGRILVSVMGVVVAALSVTGVVIWYRKRRARRAVRRSTGELRAAES